MPFDIRPLTSKGAFLIACYYPFAVPFALQNIFRTRLLNECQPINARVVAMIDQNLTLKAA